MGLPHSLLTNMWLQHICSAGGHFLRSFAYAITIVAMDHYLLVRRAFARAPPCINSASGATQCCRSHRFSYIFCIT